MSHKINPREVLSHLNKLGYTNIDATQLQAFMTDLKKLMKYGERKLTDIAFKQQQKFDILKESSASLLSSEKFDETETDAIIYKNCKSYLLHSKSSSTLLDERHSIVNNSPTRPATVPSPLKNASPSKKSNKSFNQSMESTSNSTIACPVHFFRGIGCPERRRSKSIGTACTCPIDASSQISSSCIKDKTNKKGRRAVCSTIEPKIETNATCSYPDSYDDKYYYSKYCPSEKKTKKFVGKRNYTHDFTHPCYCPGSMKPRSAVIKCNIGCKPAFPKCDPVNLHKYYERQWRINRIPGENMPREQRFRWCLREKISCGPPVRLKKPLMKRYDVVLPIN